MAVAKPMKRVLALTGLLVLLFTLFSATGCNKEPEVGYGGEVKTAPGAENFKPGKGGGGMTVDPNN